MVSTSRDTDNAIVSTLLQLSEMFPLLRVFFFFLIYLRGILVHHIIIHYVFSEAVRDCKICSWSDFLHLQVENKSQDTSKSDPVNQRRMLISTV